LRVFGSCGCFGVWLFGLFGGVVLGFGVVFFFFLSMLSLDSKRENLELISYVLVCYVHRKAEVSVEEKRKVENHMLFFLDITLVIYRSSPSHSAI